MPELHLTRGLPGSGKTTFARAWVAEDPDHRVRVNRDDIRELLHGPGRFGGSTESATTSVSHTSIRQFLRKGWDVICDDTNLNNRNLRNLVGIAEQTGAELVYHDFPMSVDDAIAADAQRETQVGPVVIERFARFLGPDGQLPEPPQADRPRLFKPYEPNWGAPPAFIVDIDGTLAHNGGHRSFFDYSDRVLADGVHGPVLILVQLLERAGFTPIIMSGRDDACRDLTVQWLSERCDLEEADYVGPFMRQTGDRRDDGIVKLELFDAHVRDHYNVRWVLDDRNRVVQAWRSIGLTVLQVADGDF